MGKKISKRIEKNIEEKEPVNDQPVPSTVSPVDEQPAPTTDSLVNDQQEPITDTHQEPKPKKYVPGLNTAFVYTTEYSKQKVYELNWQNVPVMRRTSDDYMNASNILQAAKVPKEKRKKIIKKLCSLVPFERIEEGYYKYQGVWVPLKAAKSLAERWNVYEYIKPIFDK
ncbi:hypothetical protein HK103_000793 [Boothiomyces macroporosus]|uniref:HTH APSES-type domain-containing protein n=1 Tax=Boothiomyces macroporosus TaxID=261099 RepID=A0AAD5UB46_9FUNG|nr:hypothetical protein HK103_000793 [Boothiomyces macroporosus]